MADVDLSYEEVGEILRLIEELDYDEVTLEFGDVKIHAARVSSTAAAGPSAASPAPVAAGPPTAPAEPAVAERRPAGAPAEPAPQPTPAEEGVEGAVAVTAPMVGTFYRAPAPDQPPFVEVGSRVAASDQVGIIEVMKLMNAIVAGVDGVVRRIDAENAELVEYGQPLVWIEPSS